LIRLRTMLRRAGPIVAALGLWLSAAPALGDTLTAYSQEGLGGGNTHADGFPLWSGSAESFANITPWSGSVDGVAVYDDATALGAPDMLVTGMRHDGVTGFTSAYFGVMCFNTSSIPGSATVDSVNLRITPVTKADVLEMGDGADLHVVKITPADPGDLAAGDYDAIPAGTSLGEITYAGFTTGNKNITVATSAVTKEGITCLALVMEDFIDGAYGGRTDLVDADTYLFWRSAELADVTGDPQLTVNWTPAASAAKPGAQAGAPF